MEKKKLTAEETSKQIVVPAPKKTEEEKAQDTTVVVQANDLIQQQRVPGVVGSTTQGQALRQYSRRRARSSAGVNEATADPDNQKRRRTSADQETTKVGENNYIKQVVFETQDPQECDPVDAFIFPREEYITPVSYQRGSIIDRSQTRVDKVWVLFVSCPFQEYTYLGTPLFNLRGHLVGLTYADQERLHAWSVQRIHFEVLKHYDSSSYVFNGEPRPGYT
ncbi:hypothetical protein QOZ80_2BG0200110 [Eleusine coracana subsp. coracana]|nr:hypothetical protein QOZ80_2BG0200110 [Eleusine coracana subsp. coracana]